MRIHLFFGPGFWTLRVIQIFLPGFRIQGENLTADLQTPIHPPPPILGQFERQIDSTAKYACFTG